MTGYVYYNEYDPFAAAWLRKLIEANLIAPGYVDERSIKDVQTDDLQGFYQHHFFAGIGVWSYALRRAGWSDKRPVWTGSCPCQPFSAAGSKRGFADERHLWPEFFRLIRQCRPDVVFGEQVSSPDGLAWFDTVSADLEGADYACGALDTCAAGVGAPHIRQRLFFVAVSSEKRRDGINPLPLEDLPEASRSGDAGELADSETRGQRVYRGSSRDSGYAPQRDPACDMADTDGGHQGHRKIQSGWRHVQRSQDAVAGFWDTAEWLPCTDGKARPIEPGTFPLASGATNRMGRLRGTGNALCGPQAEAFVKAAMECIP